MRTWPEVLRERLAADAEEAAECLRATLEESDAQMLAHAVQSVQAARGSLAGLDLSQSELLPNGEQVTLLHDDDYDLDDDPPDDLGDLKPDPVITEKSRARARAKRDKPQ